MTDRTQPTATAVRFPAEYGDTTTELRSWDDVAERIAASPNYMLATTTGDGTLVKYGNGPFSLALTEAGLLDELHVTNSPFVAGFGESLLSGIGNGTVVLAHAPVRYR